MDEESNKVFITASNAATSHCFTLAKRSLLAAEIQINRIWEKSVNSKDNPSLPFEIKLIDIHFYFIALRNLYRHLEKVISDPAYEHLKPELEKLNAKWFKHYGHGREAFEHIDQRLPGEKYEERIVEITENEASRKVHYGVSMKEGMFKHSNESWDISLDFFKEIKEGVTDLIALVVDV